MNTIELTETQIHSVDWLLGCPLFDSDAKAVAWDWDVTDERAAEIVKAAQSVKRDGMTLQLPTDKDVLEYLLGYTEQLVAMNGKEYIEELLDLGLSHRAAQCKANGAVRSAESLAGKLQELLA